MKTNGVLSEKCFSEFLKLIHKLTGITIASNRTSMVDGRLRKRMNALSILSYDEYLSKVQTDKSEQVFFIDIMTTNETYFFRTPRIWDYIEKKFLPEWHKNHPKQVFLSWSAAASSGEEAHSLALVCHAFKEKNPNFLYQIVGTDISQEMVSMCQQGLYKGKAIDSFKKTRPEMFQKCMRPIDGEFYQVLPEIKSRVRFQQHNLFNSLSIKDKFDLILVRNVLIYFSQPDQELVLSKLAPRLAENGVLIIGESESLSHIKTSYKHIEPLVYKIDLTDSKLPKAA